MSKHFETFWKRYPNKAGKAQAEAKWNKLKLDEEWESISKFLDWAPQNDPRWKKGFIPMGSTFVNQLRWRDHDYHLKPKLFEKNSVSTVPDPSQIVEWVKNNRNLTEKQITSPWKWIWDGTRIIGVHIPDMDPLFLRSMKSDGHSGPV